MARHSPVNSAFRGASDFLNYIVLEVEYTNSNAFCFRELRSIIEDSVPPRPTVLTHSPGFVNRPCRPRPSGGRFQKIIILERYMGGGNKVAYTHTKYKSVTGLAPHHVPDRYLRMLIFLNFYDDDSYSDLFLIIWSQDIPRNFAGGPDVIHDNTSSTVLLEKTTRLLLETESSNPRE
ncbi:hypothetical protein EVAR_13896_1 [Eumeta japonica]|uniref:Uncharacterized protein n=1 Tax=Eumeta variegata TaxID=151549 RepID=A0A4C1U9Q0_EUMVA|nr:hypothetical protein EVAR_13896_1 [Eumeta japonica]